MPPYFGIFDILFLIGLGLIIIGLYIHVYGDFFFMKRTQSIEELEIKKINNLEARIEFLEEKIERQFHQTNEMIIKLFDSMKKNLEIPVNHKNVNQNEKNDEA